MCKRFVIVFMLCFITSCASYVTKQISFEVPARENELCWSRAHSFMAQYIGYNYFQVNQYAIHIGAENKIRQMVILREIGPDKTKYIVIGRYLCDPLAGESEEYGLNRITDIMYKAQFYITSGQTSN